MCMFLDSQSRDSHPLALYDCTHHTTFSTQASRLPVLHITSQHPWGCSVKKSMSNIDVFAQFTSELPVFVVNHYSRNPTAASDDRNRLLLNKLVSAT